MKVGYLIEQLKLLDPEAIVVMSKDGEGNSFSPLSDIADEMVYREESSWEGEIGYEKLTDELVDAGYGEEDIIEDGVPCIVMWPVN